MSKKILIPSFEASPIDLEKELDDLLSTALSEAQAGFDKSIIDDLSLQQEAKHFYDLVVGGLQVKGLIEPNRPAPPKDNYNDMVKDAINKYFLDKGIDPATIEFQFNDCKLKYSGDSVIVEDIIVEFKDIMDKTK